jgi:hypothetical protein
MASVKYGDLEWAFTYVSTGQQGDHSAFVERDTGQIFWTSESGDQNDNPPEDVENLQRYLPVPHKNELELGRQLVLRFVELEMPDCYEEVINIFRGRGAYRRYRMLLESRNALDRWQTYEQTAVRRALSDWCQQNRLLLLEE